VLSAPAHHGRVFFFSAFRTVSGGAMKKNSVLLHRSAGKFTVDFAGLSE
jgi:hypothetical protein